MSTFTTNITLLNAVTATGVTTSQVVDISMREYVAIQFTAAGITSGSGVFTVDVSNDGSNWVNSVSFQDPKSTNATTYVTSKTLATNTTDGAVFPIAPWRFLRVNVNVTTQGIYTAVLQAAS